MIIRIKKIFVLKKSSYNHPWFVQLKVVSNKLTCVWYKHTALTSPFSLIFAHVKRDRVIPEFEGNNACTKTKTSFRVIPVQTLTILLHRKQGRR